MTPREVLAETIHDAMGCAVRYDVCSGISKYCYDVAGALIGAGYEIVPTALVDAVLDHSARINHLAGLATPLGPNTEAVIGHAVEARRALAAYRAPVLLGQTEDAET